MSIALLTFALVGTLCLLASIVLGYGVPGNPQAVRAHFLLALLSTFLLVMAHSFIMFFLIATGVEMKDMEKERGWGDSFRRRTVALKGRVFPVMTFALLVVIANFVLGAAAHTRALPALVHEATAWLTLVLCLYALQREWEVLGENNRLIEEAGMRREEKRGAS
jgi:hypothetical protein